MSATTSKHQDPSITIDTSRVYKVDAGQCPKCGNFKTWGFRIQNPNSGKMMPGHVTAEGYLINNGECPYYALLRKNAPAAQDGQGTVAPAGTPTTQQGPAAIPPAQGDQRARPKRQAPAPVQAPVQPAVQAPVQAPAAIGAVAAPDGGVTFTIGGTPVATASKLDALKLCSRVLDIVAGGAP